MLVSFFSMLSVYSIFFFASEKRISAACSGESFGSEISGIAKGIAPLFTDFNSCTLPWSGNTEAKAALAFSASSFA